MSGRLYTGTARLPGFTTGWAVNETANRFLEVSKITIQATSIISSVSATELFQPTNQCKKDRREGGLN